MAISLNSGYHFIAVLFYCICLFHIITAGYLSYYCWYLYHCSWDFISLQLDIFHIIAGAYIICSCDFISYMYFILIQIAIGYLLFHYYTYFIEFLKSCDYIPTVM